MVEPELKIKPLEKSAKEIDINTALFDVDNPVVFTSERGNSVTLKFYYLQHNASNIMSINGISKLIELKLAPSPLIVDCGPSDEQVKGVTEKCRLIRLLDYSVSTQSADGWELIAYRLNTVYFADVTEARVKTDVKVYSSPNYRFKPGQQSDTIEIPNLGKVRFTLTAG